MVRKAQGGSRERLLLSRDHDEHYLSKGSFTVAAADLKRDTADDVEAIQL